jgi:predicted regulator of Ras-like GTPase activity (Roadblock/LC7/MglB family)
MLGLFKRMLSKPDLAPEAPAAKPAPLARPTPVARPATPTPVAQVQPPRPRVARPPATSTHVQVALAGIAAGLPEALRHKVPSNPDQFIPIPIDKVIPQLGEGQIVITAAELRECSPDHFAALVGHDDLSVTLPLAEIVKQLSAAHFTRREQQRTEVPDEVAPVFAPGSSGATVPKAVTAVTAKPAPTPRPQPTVTTTSTEATPSASPAAPETKISMSPQALAALNGRATPPIATPTRAATVFAKPSATPLGSRPTVPGKPGVTLPKKTAAKLTGELAVPLASVCDEWVTEVRTQLAEIDVTKAQIFVPFEQLEPAMKSGKVLFSWQEVAAWIKPPLPIPPTAKVGEMAVELPLKVIAPLFMTHHRGGTQKRVTVDTAIPDLFESVNSDGLAPAQVPQPPPPAAPAVAVEPVSLAPVPVAPAPRVVPTAPVIPVSAPLPISSPPVTPTPALKPAAAPPAPAQGSVSLEQIIGAAASRFSAKEIVANTARLPGAAGALLALSDGLLVTSQAPQQIKAETIAAFLPQMFGRMNQYTKELALGPLEYLALGVEGGHWHIIKSPNIYFAVLGKRGETLPLNLLAQVAAELSSQSK